VARLDTVHRRDRQQTDGWTPHDGVGRYMQASRGKKASTAELTQLNSTV